MNIQRLAKIVIKKKVSVDDVIELAAASAVAFGTVAYIVKKALDKSKEYREQEAAKERGKDDQA